MNRGLNLALWLAAGLLGGFATRYISPAPVQAQIKTLLPKEIIARKFTLVNDGGNPAGIFGFDENGNPNVELLDKTGKRDLEREWQSAGQPIDPHHGEVKRTMSDTRKGKGGRLV